MDRRKMRILQAVTDDYILTAEPVGSRTLARKYKLGVSPATIRNEMADLEESGYLEQPHTSAGRIPSDKGYRFYVDTLMRPMRLTEAERELIRAELLARRRAIEEMIHHTARMLALWTRYTSLVLAPRLSEAAFRHIEFVPLDSHHVLVVLVTGPGMVQDRIVAMTEPVDQDELRQLAHFLNQRLRGVRLRDVGRTLLDELQDEIRDARLYAEAVELLSRGLEGGGSEAVYLDGAVNILEQPEFRDVARARTVLSLMGDQETLIGVLTDLAAGEGVTVTIGRENRREELRECSVVTATYSVGGEVVGAIGVVGPTRMEYSKVLAVVECIAATLSDVLTDLGRR